MTSAGARRRSIDRTAGGRLGLMAGWRAITAQPSAKYACVGGPLEWRRVAANRHRFGPRPSVKLTSESLECIIISEKRRVLKNVLS